MVRGKDRERKEAWEREKKDRSGRRKTRSSEGRRRKPLSDVFPGLSQCSSDAESAVGPPMLTGGDGQHNPVSDDTLLGRGKTAGHCERYSC
jgi:hypothetical protein